MKLNSGVHIVNLVELIRIIVEKLKYKYKYKQLKVELTKKNSQKAIENKIKSRWYE